MTVSSESSTPRRGVPRWAALGALFGALGALSIWVWAPIGVSTTYPRLIGSVFQIIDPDYAKSNPMLVQIGGLFVPETFLAIGLFVGGALASRLGKKNAGAASSPAATSAGDANEAKGTPVGRLVQAFVGGFLILFGARMAGGCTSGHIISGMIQLSASAFVFAVGVFASALPLARALSRAPRTGGVR